MSTPRGPSMAISKQKKSPSKPSLPEARTVSFVTRIEGVERVAITGDFTEWSPEGVALQNSTSNEWRTKLELRPGSYQYRLVIDGHWCDDAQASERVANGFGTLNCVLKVE